MKTKIKIIQGLIIIAGAAAFAPTVSAKGMDCEKLKQTIEAKLQANHVLEHTLEVADVGAAVNGTEVGRCDGGKRKVVYKRSAKAAAGTTEPAKSEKSR